jgi:hypothetical protein
MKAYQAGLVGDDLRNGGTPERGSFPADDLRLAGMTFLVILLAAVLRLANLGASSLTLDEVNDHQLVSGSFLHSLTSPNGFPPGYSIVIQSIHWLLPTAYDQRYFAVFCGTLAVGVGCYAAYCWLGRSAVVPVGLVLALHPSLVYLAREARPYALEHLFAAIVLVGVSPRWLARSYWPAAVGILGLVLTTYSSIVFAGIAGVLVLLSALRSRRWRELIWPSVLVAAGFAAVLATMGADYAKQRRLSADYPATINEGLQGLRRFVHTLTSLFFGYSAFGSPHTRTTRSDSSLALEAMPYLLGTALLVAGALVVAISRGRKKSFRYAPATIQLTVLALGPVAAWTLLSYFAGFDFRGRYFALAAFPMAVLLVSCVPALRKWLAVVLVVTLLVLTSISNYHRIYSAEFANDDYQGLAKYFESVQPGSTVYLIPGAAIGQLKSYDASLAWLDHSGLRGPYTSAELAKLQNWVSQQQIDNSKCSLLVLADLELIDPDHEFVPFLTTHGVTLKSTFHSVGIDVYRACGVILQPRTPD